MSTTITTTNNGLRVFTHQPITQNQPSDPNTYRKLPADEDGYVSGIRCEKGHSGNTRYVQSGAFVQCQGCGDQRYTADIWDRIEPAKE